VVLGVELAAKLVVAGVAMAVVVGGCLLHSIQEAEDKEARHRKAPLEMVNTIEVEAGVTGVDLAEDAVGLRKLRSSS
jgi:hypothetical protein